MLKLLPKKDVQNVAKDINIQLTDEDLVSLGLSEAAPAQISDDASKNADKAAK